MRERMLGFIRGLAALIVVLVFSAIVSAAVAWGEGPLRSGEPPQEDFVTAYDDAWAMYEDAKEYEEGLGNTVTYDGNSAFTEYVGSSSYAVVEIYYTVTPP